MGRILIYFTVFLAGATAARAQSFCAPAVDHTSRILKPIAQGVAQSEPVQFALKRYAGKLDIVYCTSGVALEYSDQRGGDIYLLAIDVRQTTTFYLLNQIRVLVDGRRVSVLKFADTTKILEGWFRGLRYKSAGALPRVSAVDLAARLAAFTESRADERTITSLPVRAPSAVSDSYFLVTWSAEIARGVVIVQNRRSGEVHVADDLNLREGLVEPLRALASPPGGGGGGLGFPRLEELN